MAFTGTAVQEQISERCMRVSGLSLAASAAGTIGLFGGAGEVDLEDGFQPKAYGEVSQIEGCWVTFEATTLVAAGEVPVLRIVKTGADLTFVITITNDDAVNASPVMVFYIHWH